MINHDQGNINVKAENVHSSVVETFIKAGVDKNVAEQCSEGLVQASLRGVDTHGIRLFPHYLAAIESGRINPMPEFRFDQTSSSTGKLNGDHAFGHSSGIVAMHHAITLAEESGSGFVSVRNSSHCGALAYFAMEACKKDMIGWAFTHATARMKSPGSNREYFGTNPICFAAPMESEEPFCFDAAPTPIPFHKILHHRETDSPLPEGSAADEQGIEITNPHRATQLLPIGDYKGFGWAIMVDILSSLLSGMPGGRGVSKMYGDMSEKRYLGHFFGALRIDVFESPEVFKERLQKLADSVRNEPRLNRESENLMPGDPEKIMMRKRLKEGIPIAEHEMKKLNQVFKEYGIQTIT